MDTEILIDDDEITLIRTSSTGVIDVVTAPIEQVRAALNRGGPIAEDIASGRVQITLPEPAAG